MDSMSSQPVNAFISYTTKDLLSAEELCSDLEKAGANCWMAPRNLTLGGNTAQQIVDAVGHASVFIVVFSAQTNGSNKVLREAMLASSQRVPIVLWQIDDTQPTDSFAYTLGRAPRIHRAGTPHHSLQALLEAISRYAGGAPSKTESEQGRSADQIAAAAQRPAEHATAGQKTIGLVFMDIDSIPFGTNFRTHIDGALSTSKVLIAIIGPKWLGKRLLLRSRIFDPDDPVRIELETALRKQVSIIPVLLDRTPMPSASELPQSLKDVADLNAAELSSGRDFDTHAERLLRSVESILTKSRP
jgi:hypothetical protein